MIRFLNNLAIRLNFRVILFVFFAGGEPVMSEGPLLSQRLHRPRESHPIHSGNRDSSFNSYCKHKCAFKTLI